MSTDAQDSLLRSSALASGLVTVEQLDFCLRLARHRQSQHGIATETSIPDPLLAEILIEQGALSVYQADQLRAGRTKFFLGPYLITDWIGQGGMGQVFKGTHSMMGRVCAVKVLPGYRATAEARESFAREIRMQANLDCPYLVRAFDAGQDGTVHYLVTEYVPGMDLRRLVKNRHRLPIQEAARIVMHAALGLDYAHQQGMVHRDVKPGNILVTPEGDAKVSDVGLAGFAKDLMSDPRAGKIVGTTDYLSPEQIRTPMEVQPASDIYSLGCTLYYSVCGKVPFPGGDTTSKLRRHLEETPWHPRKFAPDIPEDFVDIIADMMEKNPKQRISSAAEVASRLEPWVEDSYSTASVTMHPSPWMAPPPPSDNQDAVNYATNAYEPNLGDSAAMQSSRAAGFSTATTDDSGLSPQVSSDGALVDTGYSQDSATVGSRSFQADLDDGRQTQFPQIDPLAPSASSLSSGMGSPEPHAAQSPLSSGLLIALTAAIVIPPALLVGAILGYVVSLNR